MTEGLPRWAFAAHVLARSAVALAFAACAPANLGIIAPPSLADGAAHFEAAMAPVDAPSRVAPKDWARGERRSWDSWERNYDTWHHLTIRGFAGAGFTPSPSLSVDAGVRAPVVPLELEAGLWGPVTPGWHARAGIGIPLSDGRELEGDGREWELPVLFGYEWQLLPCSDCNPAAHSLELVGGLAATRWLDKNVGMTGSLLGGVRFASNWFPETPTVLLRLGIAIQP